MDKLFASLIAIAIPLLFAIKVRANPTEYVFIAPPEVDNEVEIPASETDYPLYECSPEADDSDEETALDSHDCTCTDCDEFTQDSESNEQLTLDKDKEPE